uniref:REM-1 domain-containing protein n=1 Tax=Echinococcus canadensis TaxID=519352 RepID=A0A915EXL8_9CEST
MLALDVRVNRLNQIKVKLQQLPKEKFVTPKNSKKAFAHIKQLNEQIKDLSEDVGELDTCSLILRHKLPQEMLRAMRDNAASNEEAIASIQKALDIEIRVRNGAERLIQTYKDGPRNCLESARKQLGVAEAKIGFLRNQLARLKHAGSDDQTLLSPLPSNGVKLTSPTSRQHLFPLEEEEDLHAVSMEPPLMLLLRRVKLCLYR